MARAPTRAEKKFGDGKVVTASPGRARVRFLGNWGDMDGGNG